MVQRDSLRWPIHCKGLLLALLATGVCVSAKALPNGPSRKLPASFETLSCCVSQLMAPILNMRANSVSKLFSNFSSRSIPLSCSEC